MAAKYKELSNKLVDLLGGKDNITYFTHCVTRLRFNVKDKDLVQGDVIKGLSGVLGSQWSGDQYQIIIGTTVADAYNEILAKNDLKMDSAASAKKDVNTEKKKFKMYSLFETLHC